MKNSKYKIASFWRRLCARIIDITIILLISILCGWLFLEKKIANNDINWIFKHFSLFYIYSLIIIFLLIFLNIILPIIWKGKTLGHFVMRIKIISENNLKINLIKREIFWSLAWIVCALLVMIIINHTLFLKFAMSSKNKKVVFTIWETIRITFVSTFASIVIFIQMICAISIIVRQGQGLHDTFSKTKVVLIKNTKDKTWEHDLINQEFNNLLKPIKYEKEIIEFIDE